VAGDLPLRVGRAADSAGRGGRLPGL